MAKQKNPQGKMNLTPQQLNTHAIVTARQAVFCTIAMAEVLGKGPFAIKMLKNGNGLALDVGWVLSRAAVPSDSPEFILRFIPILNKDRGGITLKLFYSDACPDWVREKVAERMVLIQQQNAQVERDMMDDLRQGGWV